MAIYHIVLVKFEPGVTEEKIKAWKVLASQLPSKIPEIKKLEVGTKIPHQFDRGWDDGIIFHFDNEIDLKTYLPHPDHLAYMQACSGTIADRLCFDLLV
ncbi:hypothetical protein NEOLEDRAFT_137516 [Neolentinus lepideus HHB14362 ss-1]|uniref:Stress-response A/B barrel domain-containing protein n=1 Tax=Neolentinus lepideus HHB14362 ss-1 TaxID=1314782 RepID=A0A165TYY1_9AGAM|nr:hypothetical protein NEOLEDRAFT_137516 [Neolentinus lepideus HHB14362 ss-1]